MKCKACTTEDEEVIDNMIYCKSKTMGILNYDIFDRLHSIKRTKLANNEKESCALKSKTEPKEICTNETNAIWENDGLENRPFHLKKSQTDSIDTEKCPTQLSISTSTTEDEEVITICYEVITI